MRDWERKSKLSYEMIERLKSLAADMAWDDDADFTANDCSGSSSSILDYVFCGGKESGRIQLARQILDDLGIEY